jgi:predicted transcriptional regulator YdeE
MTMFTVSVSQRPQLWLFGVSVRTSMSNASVDCPHLWEKVFAPRMHEISGKKSGEHGPSYGISILIDAQHFEYWAAMPVREGIARPEGMGQIELPAGFYAGCLVPSLERLGEAYTCLYEAWPKTVTSYRPNMQAPCFEYYDERYMKSGAFEVSMPILVRCNT